MAIYGYGSKLQWKITQPYMVQNPVAITSSLDITII